MKKIRASNVICYSELIIVGVCDCWYHSSSDLYCISVKTRFVHVSLYSHIALKVGPRGLTPWGQEEGAYTTIHGGSDLCHLNLTPTASSRHGSDPDIFALGNHS